MNKDQIISQDIVAAKGSFPTPAFLANIRNQMGSQPLGLTNQVPNNQFSTLIAAAVSQQQQITTSPSKSISSKGKSTVFVPPEVAMNIMNLNPNRVRSSREEEINDADDEGVPGMEIDDDDDENDSDQDVKPFLKKMEPPIVSRKRRNNRSDSKVSSSSSPVAVGLLSSQESSQDGDDVDEEMPKFASEDKKLRNKSLKSSDLDLKNDDDSLSGSRSNRDHETKNFKSPAPSPKKRRRGRMRNLSQSDCRDPSSGPLFSERTRERTLGCRTRGMLTYYLFAFCFQLMNSQPLLHRSISSQHRITSFRSWLQP